MRRDITFILLLLICVLATVVAGPREAASLATVHECNYCHNIHGAPGFSLLSTAQVEVLCLTCHGPTGISTLKADVHSNKTPRSSYPDFRISCRGCHDPHDNVASWTGGLNIKLIGPRKEALTSYATVSTPNSGVRYVVFQSRGTDEGQPSLHSFADSDQDGNSYYDGICETCHTLTGHHTNDAPDLLHHTGETCTRCHLHTKRFLK